MPTWVKSFLGVLVGGIAGGAVGLGLLKYGSLLPDVGKFATPTGPGQILGIVPLIAIFGMPISGALVGGIIGAVLDDSIRTDSGGRGVSLHALMANAWPLILQGFLGLVVGGIAGGAIALGLLPLVLDHLKREGPNDPHAQFFLSLGVGLGLPVFGASIGGALGAVLALIPAWHRRREPRRDDFITPPAPAQTTPAPSPGRCPHCGELNSGKALACVICRRRLPWADSVNRATPAQPPLSGLPPAGLPPQGASTTPAPSASPQLPAPGASGAAHINASSAVDWLPTAASGIKLRRRAGRLLTQYMPTASGTRHRALADNAGELVPITIICAVVSIVFLLFAPWLLALPVVLMLSAMVVMKAIAVRRIAALELDPTKRRPARGATAQVALGAEEKVLGTLVGIMTTGWQSEFGVCHIKNPHNAMIITNRHVFLLFVPLPGGDLMVDGADMRYDYFIAGKKKLEEKLGEMLSSMSLEEIINSDADNSALSRDDLQPVKPPGSFGPFKSATLTLITKDGQKYSYYFRDQSDLVKAVQLLRV